MPELPEVETIRLGLQKHLVGHTIEKIDIRLKKQFNGDPKTVTGAKIVAVRRFGKGLILDLDNGFSIAIHVKMTGRLVYSAGSATNSFYLTDKHTHIVFYLDHDSILTYNDIRQFGWIKVVKTKEIGKLPFFKSLGPEPLKDLTAVKFSQILSKAKTPVKTLIMDQSKIAGIGNIYANDALFLARIHPGRPAMSLSAKEVKALFNSIEKVLKKGIEAGGASEWNYVNALGEKGGYQNFFQVYNRAGEPCFICGAVIQRSKMGGRSSFFCLSCQL